MTHTHTRHFTTKKIVGNVRRDSLVDLWHTPLGKCVAGIPLRPACHCCPWYIWSVRMGLPAWGNKTNHVWIYVFKQIVRLSKSQQNQIISHLYRCVSIYIYIALHYILQIELVIGHAIAVTIVPVDHGPNALVIHGSSMFS